MIHGYPQCHSAVVTGLGTALCFTYLLLLLVDYALEMLHATPPLAVSSQVRFVLSLS